MTPTASRAVWACFVLTALAILFLMTQEPAERQAAELPPRAQAEDTAPRLRGREVMLPPGAQAEDTVPRRVGREVIGRARRVPATRDAPPGGAVVTILAEESREPIVGAHWRVDRGVQTVAEGVSDANGTILLLAEAVNAWEHSRLRIWADGRRDENVPMPKDVRGSTVEIVLAKFHVDFAGQVLDETGRPIEGAGVVVSYWNMMSSVSDQPGDLFRTTTDSQGRFHLSAKVWHPDIEGVDGHVLWAGAPGFLPSRLEPDKRGEIELAIRLARDPDGGVLELCALLPDGAPASDGDLWLEGVPQEHAVRRFAELWRDPTDTRSPGWGTWKTIGGRETWWRRLGADGLCTVHPIRPGLHRLQVLAGGYAADLMVNVVLPPSVTRVQVRLEPLRTVTGFLRVDQDPNWYCDHESHEHVVRYDDWPEPPQPRTVASGPFELRDLPPRVDSMTILTAGHPQVVVPLPQEGPLHVGEALIRSAREADGILRWPEGRKPEPWSGVRLVDREGTLAEATTYYTSDGGPYFRLVLSRRPAPDAWIVVRLRMSDGDRSPEIRFDGPFDFVSGLPLDLTLPPSVPARED